MTLDYKKGAAPLYLQISEIIKERIENNTYKYCEVIPSELELEKTFKVSRITVRQAIAELERLGYVKRERGIGTTVIYTSKFNEYSMQIKSFTDEMKERGIEASTSNISIKKVKANEEVANVFGIAEGKEVYLLHRVRCGDDVPIVIFDTYLSGTYEFPLDKESYNTSMYDVFEQIGVQRPSKVLETFSAIKANKQQAKDLNIEVNSPIFKRVRISYTREDEIIEYTKAYYRGDTYTYTVEYENK